MANSKLEEYRQRLAEMYKAKSNDKLNTDANVEMLLSPNKTVSNTDLNGWQKFGAGYQQFRDSLATTFLDLGEGVIDALAMPVGAIAEWNGDTTTKNNVDEFVKKEWLSTAPQQEWWQKVNNVLGFDFLWDEKTKEVAMSKQALPEVADQVASGIGSALGFVALSSIPYVGAVVAGFGAGGASAEQALKEGAGTTEALGYGVASGVLESTIEQVSGKLGGKIAGIGKGTAKATGEVGQSVVGKLGKSFVKDFLEEGAEEVISDLIDPALQRATYKRDEKLVDLYKDQVSLESIGKTFFVGGLTGGLMGGINTTIGIASYGVDGVNAMETMTEAQQKINEVVKLEKKENKTSKDLQKIETLKKEIVELNATYEAQIESLKNKTGEQSRKAKKFELATEYFNDISNASSQDLAIRDAIDKFNKKYKANFKYKGVKQDVFTNYVKSIRGDEYQAGDEFANAFVLTDNGIIVNKDSQAYKEGRLYNVIGHEFIHTIEKTEGYKELFNNFVKGFTQEELNAKIQEYKVDRGYGEQSDEYLLQEAFADYIGENVAINYQEFAKMLGTNSKWSKIKEKFLGYRGSLTEGYRNLQSKVKEALTTAGSSSMDMAKASRNSNVLKNIEQFAKENNIKKLNEEELAVVQSKTEKYMKKGHGFTTDKTYACAIHIEFVEVDTLNDFFEYDRIGKLLDKGKTLEGGYNKEELINLIEDIKQNGFNDALMMGFNNETKDSWIYEGNHRLAIANMLGIKKMPIYVEVIQSDRKGLNNIKINAEIQEYESDISKNEKFLEKLEEFINEKQNNIVETNQGLSNGVSSEDMLPNGLRRERMEGVPSNEANSSSSWETNWDNRREDKESSNGKRNENINSTSETVSKFSRNKVDSNGTKLTENQIEFFKESQARDENGNLIPLYHGTTWEFYTFDKQKASPEGDMGAGFYFTNKEVDADQNYADGEHSPDLHGRVASLAEQIERTDDVDYEEAKRRAEELLVGNETNVLEVYLNIKNPAYPETFVLSYEDFIQDYDMNDYEDEYEYYDKVDDDWYEHTQQIMYEVDNILDLDDYSYRQLEELFSELGSGDYRIEDLKKIVNQNYEFSDNQGNYINNEVVRAIVEACGFDGIIDNQVSKKFRSFGLTSDTTHYIVFKSNQIKLTSNENPTSNPDIRFSKNKKQIETKAVAKKLEQVEGEIVETGLSTEVKEGKSKTKGTQTPLETDSNLAWKFYSNLMNDKVYNKSNADGFIKALEQDIKNKFGNDVKIDFKGNKEQLGRNLFQDLNNPSNVSKEQAVKHFLEYFEKVEVDGVPIKEALNNIDPVLYDDFIKQMNDNLVSLFNSGSQSKMNKVVSVLTDRINRYREALRAERGYAKELLKTVHKLKATVSKHKGKNVNSALDIANAIPELNTLIVELEQLLTRTDYLKSDFRKYVANVKKAFTDNQYLQQAGYLDADLLADMDTIIQNSATLGNKKITRDEMKILRKVCTAINKVYSEYDQTVLNGKKVVASETASNFIKEIKVKDQKGKGTVHKLQKLGNIVGQNIRTTMAVMSINPYEKSFAKEVMGSLEQASNKKKHIYYDLTDNYHKKMKDKRRNLVKRLSKSNFSLGGTKFTDAQIVEIYMLSLRGDVATRHLLGEGVRIRDKNGLQTKAIKLTQENLDNIRKHVESNYADFIETLKEIFHNKAGKYYNETLNTRTGYEDALEKNYFPMKTSDLDFTANITDQSKLMGQYQEYLRPSFTKEVTNTAINSLIIEGIDVTVESFSRTMSNFAGITPTIQHLNRLFNAPVQYEGKTTTLMQHIKENYYEDFDSEFSRLLINMQDRRTKGSVNKLGAKIRGGIASASLAGNPKVWFLQTVSFPIAMSELGFANSMKGIASLPLDLDTVEKSSPYFKDRWHNDDVRNAMLNTTNIAGKAHTALSKIGDFFGKPIGFFSKQLDKLVIKSAIAKVAKDNKTTVKQVRSDKTLLKQALYEAEQVCRRTQSQFDVLESGSTIYESGEIMKSLYMFSSDGRVIGNLLRTKFHDAVASKNFKPLLKTVSGVFVTQLLVALLDVAYRHFLDKTEDEDEDGKITDDMFHDFLVGTVENMTVNLVPIIRDVYNKFVHGYDLNNVTLDYFNDLIDSISAMTNKLGSDDPITDKDIYSFTKVFGTTFGIPVKNLSEFTTAIFTKFNAEWAIRTQDVLYNKSNSDAKNELAYSYNNKQISKLVGKTGGLLSKAGLDTPNTKTCTEMARLYSLGFTQIYPTVDIDTFTYEGQQFRLSDAQQVKFSKIYNDATKEVEALISSSAYYKLSDRDKAKAIKKLYSLYYNLAKAEFISDYEYSNTELALFEIDAHDLVLYLAHIDTIKATPKLSKKEQVIYYLKRQRLNKKELDAIYSILGYKVESSNSILGNSMLSSSLLK